MRRLSSNSFAMVFPIIVVACGGGSDESNATTDASSAGNDAASVVTSTDSGGVEGSSSFDSQSDVVSASETGPGQDGGAAKDVVLADQAPEILPGSVHVDIDGVRKDFPIVSDDWNIDGIVVSFAAAPQGGQRPYPLVITLPKGTATGTVRCGDVPIFLLMYENETLGAAWSSITPCEINVTQAAQKRGERWVGTFSGDLEGMQIGDGAPTANIKFTNGVFDVPRLGH